MCVHLLLSGLWFSAQVSEPLSKANWQGYRHLVIVKEFWPKVIPRTAFYAWYSQNWNKQDLVNLRSLWGVAEAHVIREVGYKGAHQAPPLPMDPRFPWAAASSLGIMLLLGALAQTRGLALQCQEEAVKFLSRMCSRISDAKWVLKLLPTVQLPVEERLVDLGEFWKHFSPQDQRTLKNRLAKKQNNEHVQVLNKPLEIGRPLVLD